MESKLTLFPPNYRIFFKLISIPASSVMRLANECRPEWLEQVSPFSFPQAHRKPFGWKATTARCPCWSPRLPCSCSPLAALELYVNKTTIIAIKLLILRSFQRKGLCNSGLKAKSTTFVRNITTIRLRSQFVILKMNINMTDKIEKKESSELCISHRRIH